MPQQWEQIKDLLAIQERMNRLLEEAMGHPAMAGEEANTSAWTPQVDIYETERELVIKADLPEVSKEDIQVELENGKLMLEGERRLPGDLRREQFHCNERPYGRFSRSFVLPQNIDQEKIRADYKQGVLIITIPKQNQAQPRQITIKIS